MMKQVRKKTAMHVQSKKDKLYDFDVPVVKNMVSALCDARS